MKSNAERVREWRAKHLTVSRERQRGYQSWQRAKVKAASSLKAPSPPAEPAPDVQPAAEPAPVLTVKAPFGDTGKLARLLAAGKAKTRAPEPEPVPALDSPSLPYDVPPPGFDSLPPDLRASWVKLHWSSLLTDELAQERVDERLAECRTSTGRRKL